LPAAFQFLNSKLIAIVGKCLQFYSIVLAIRILEQAYSLSK